MAILISPNGDFTRDIRLHCYKDIQQLLGEKIETFEKVVHGGKEYTVITDEDAYLKQLIPNEYAFNKFGLYIHGAVLLVDERENKIKEKQSG